MRKPRSPVMVCVLLVSSLSWALPAEDVLETTYDESETQPYEAIPFFWILSVADGWAGQAAVAGISLSVPPSPFAERRRNYESSHRPTKAPVARVSLYTLSWLATTASTLQPLSRTTIKRPQISSGYFLVAEGCPNNITAGNGGPAVYRDKTYLATSDLSGFLIETRVKWRTTCF